MFNFKIKYFTQIQSIGDYYELNAESVPGTEEAQDEYLAVIEGYFSDNTQEIATNLRNKLPKVQESEASLGNVSIKSKNNE